jgi:hypothetical protein
MILLVDPARLIVQETVHASDASEVVKVADLIAESGSNGYLRSLFQGSCANAGLDRKIELPRKIEAPGSCMDRGR